MVPFWIDRYGCGIPPQRNQNAPEAKAKGCKVIGGLGMLLWQGAEAFRLFTGKEMPVKEVYEKYFQ